LPLPPPPDALRRRDRRNVRYDVPSHDRALPANGKGTVVLIAAMGRRCPSRTPPCNGPAANGRPYGAGRGRRRGRHDEA
jgi:hypothetical protein